MLAVRDLSFSFRHNALFSHLSFDIRPGELLHLIGPNGAGKSTLLSILAGLRLPTSGEVNLFRGEAAVEDRRLFVEYLPAEANGLYLKLSATNNLHFWPAVRGRNISDDRIQEELSLWGLGHRLIREGFPVEKFSTGMRRRLALARLRLADCDLWLLDEPIYGLDSKGIELFRKIVRDHLDSQGMVLVISHDTAPLDGLITKTVALNP